MRDDPLIVPIIFTIALVFYAFGYSFGKHAGYDRALKDMPQKVEVNIDQQCVKWLFDNNLKEARQRMCGGKK